MSEDKTTFRTDLGPVVVDVVTCDNCGQQAQEDYAVGWLEVSPMGVQTYTIMSKFGGDDSHFCGERCLVGYLTGEVLESSPTEE